MIEVIIHGRGGQGVSVTSRLLAAALFAEGKYVQAFPSFEVERRGAPATAYLRYDNQEIWLRCGIYHADHLIILDSSILLSADGIRKLKPGGWIVINASRLPDFPTSGNGCKIAAVNVDQIAIDHKLGTRVSPVVSGAILGAFARVTDEVKLESIELAIGQHVKEQVEATKMAMRKVYEQVVEATI